MSKYLDNNGVLYLWGKIKNLLSAKMDKTDGMGLSTNDYTTEDKEKLASLENYTLPEASAEVLGGVKVGSGLKVTDGVLSVEEAGSVSWEHIKDMPDVALKSDLSSVYKYKGSVANYASLPTEDNVTGDVWNVETSGMNYAWDGDKWDTLGEIFEIQSITNAEIDAIMEG